MLIRSYPPFSRAIADQSSVQVMPTTMRPVLFTTA